jgi:hypothetical protein
MRQLAGIERSRWKQKCGGVYPARSAAWKIVDPLGTRISTPSIVTVISPATGAKDRSAGTSSGARRVGTPVDGGRIDASPSGERRRPP